MEKLTLLLGLFEAARQLGHKLGEILDDSDDDEE